MTWTPREIEDLVREVMRRLTASGAADAPAAAPQDQPAGGPDPGVWELHQHVVTLRDVQQCPPAVRVVRVPRRAVITPAAREWAREMSIAWERCDRPSPRHAPATLCLGTCDVPWRAALLAAELTRRGVNVHVLPPLGLATVVAELADGVVRGGARGLLVTPHAAAAACLANRHRGMRAAVLARPGELPDLLASMAVNVLVVAPESMSRFALLRLAQQLAAAACDPESSRHGRLLSPATGA